MQQSTLFKCGFSKAIISEHGKCYDVTQSMPKTALINAKPVICEVCQENFTSKQYLDTHIFWKHPTPAGKHQREHHQLPVNINEGTPLPKGVVELGLTAPESLTNNEDRGSTSARCGVSLTTKTQRQRLTDKFTTDAKWGR